MIKVLKRYDHGQLNIKLPKKECRILAMQDKKIDCAIIWFCLFPNIMVDNFSN